MRFNNESNSKAGSSIGSELAESQTPSAQLPERTKAQAEEDSSKSTFQDIRQVIHAAQRPLPTETGDGSYIEEETNSGLWAELRRLGFSDANTLISFLKTKVTRQPIDDKTMIMERIIQLVSKLPHDSENRTRLTNLFLNELWDSLPHPPLQYVGEKYAYRSADGSYNNPTLPWLGAANTEYARSIRPETTRLPNLPDAGLVFDSLFARDEFRPHPNKVSSIFFTWASLIIHDIFQTDPKDENKNKTSSYLDLSILYGDNQEEQNMVRTFEDGKLKPDCFSEPRLQALPAACGVILVMLNRFHNYVPQVDRLSAQEADKAWAKYDNDLFQTGRLITCGLYINITLYDYLRTIVNLNRTNSTWCLDPRVRMGEQETTPSGLGNQCSVEFNLSYRWHSTISQEDEKWTEETYRRLVKKPAEESTVEELLGALHKYGKNLNRDPSKRTFAGLQRQEDGTFKDEELVSILTEAIESVSGSFGARNVPKVLRSVEILGIEQARRWNVGTLNEFRKFFDLKPYRSFEEINSDPEVADQLRHLYEKPDYVELYPGIVAEEAKEPMVPGVGIAPGYTVSRAVLSDAVALVRGDRFYTADYNARNLTNWGFTESHYDLETNQGCIFYKLALRAFPNWFKPNSIYAHYPMTVPDENKVIMERLGREADYSWVRPAYTPPRTNIFSYPNVRRILGDQDSFHVVWGEATEYIFGRPGADFMLSGDTSFHAGQQRTMQKSLYRGQWHKHVKEFYIATTERLLKEKSCRLGGVNQVDITRETDIYINCSVGNLAHVHFASGVFSLPLKTQQNPHGIFTEHEMYQIMSAVFTAIFFDVDPAKSFPLRHKAREVAQKLGKIVETIVKKTQSSGILSSLFDPFRTNPYPLQEYGNHMIWRLLETGMGPSEITNSQILPTAIAMVPNQAQVFTQIMDYYLSDEGKEHLPAINRIAKEDSAQSDEILLRYCMEAIRLHGIFGSYREAQSHVSLEDRGRYLNIQPGEKVFVSFVDANRDPDAFPDPDTVRLDRPMESYIHYGVGPHTCLGKEASKVALTAMLRVVGRLDNLRRAPGPQGQLKKIPRPHNFYSYMVEDETSFYAFPMTFKVHFDGPM
ncbi:heme peroxidase [Aspergillus egyptiacus]|nr:heme peroxidase [Aspergillus egyptiacus]